MARRKSLNKRLSRYSRNSIGSAFLDPDTENLGDEEPYWWKNLENNTVMRPSMSYNMPNQTSPILDPNSRVDSGQLQDRWWKALETTDVSDDAKPTMPTRKQDADNNTVTTLESDEEPRIIKRKVTLRSAARKSRANPFMNISKSGTSDEKSTEESPMNKSGSIDNGTTSSNRVNKISENSSSQSHSTDVVLKLKPTLLNRRHKDRQRNVFDDVLKENELLTPTKRKSLKLSSDSKTGWLMENEIRAITESPIVKQGGTRQLVLSFENDHDLSRLPNPEAQSTLLESSSSTHGSNKDNSEMEARVLKPKSAFLKRRKKGADKNVFANIFAEEEARNDVEISKWKEKGIDANAEASTTCSVGQAGGSFRGTQSTPSNVVNEIRTGDAKAPKGSRSTEAITPSAHDPTRPVEPNASAQVSIASSDTSDKSQDPNIFVKPRSTFLKRSRKRPETNIFQEILEEDDNVDALRRSGSNTLIDLTKEDLMTKNQATVSHETSRRGSIDKESNTGSEELHLELAGSSEEDNAKEPNASARVSIAASDSSDNSQDPNIFVKPRSTFLKRSRKRSEGNIFQEILEEDDNVDALRRSESNTLIDRTKEDLMTKNLATVSRETSRRGIIEQECNTGSDKLHPKLAGSSEVDGNNAKETSVSYRSTGSDIDISELSSEPKENRQRRSALHVSPEIAEMSNRRTGSIPRIINELSKSGGGGTWSVRHRESASDVDVSVTSKYEEGNHTKSHSRNQHERDVLEENKGSSHKLYTQLSIDISDDSDQESKVIQRKRRKGTSKLGKPSFRSTVDDSEPDDLQSTPSRPSKKLRTSIRQSTVVTHTDTDLEPVLSTPKTHSKSLSKSQKLLSSRVISEAEVEVVQATPKRQSKNSSVSQKLFTSGVIREAEVEDVQATPKRQSRNSRVSQKLLRSRVLSENEAEDVQETPKRQTRSLSKSQKLLRSRVISGDEAEEVQATSKRQTRSLSKSQKLSSSRILSESETEEVQATSKRQSKSLSKPQKLLRSRVMSEDEAEEVQATSKRQTRSLSKSQKLSSSRILSELEREEVQATSKRHSKNLSKSEKLLSSRILSESETEEVQPTSKTRSKSLSKSQKLSSRVMSEDEEEDVQETPKRQSKSLSKSQKLSSSRILSESETEGVQPTSTRQSKSLSKSQKLSSRVMSEDEAEDVQETPKRQSKSLSKSQKLSSRVMSEDEAEDVQETPKRQSKSLSKSQKLSSRVMSEDEAEDVQETPKRQNKSLSKSQKLSSRVMSEDEAEDVQETPKRQSKSLSKSRKLSSRVMSEDEAEEVQATSKRQTRSLSRSQKLSSSRILSESEMEEVQATSKRHSKNLSKSEKLLSSRILSESETEEVQPTSKTQSKSLSKSQKLSSRVMSEDEAEEVQETPKRQSKSLSKSQKLSSRVMSENEAEDVQETPKRQNKSLSKSQKLSSRVMSENEAEEVQEIPKRQSKSLSKSQKLSSRVLSEDEAEDVQETPKRQSKSLSKSQKLSSRVMTEDEAEEIQSTRRTTESKSVGKAQNRSTSNAIKEFEAQDPNTPERRSKVSSKLSNDISSAANQIEPCEIDGEAKRQSKSISRVNIQSTTRIVNVSETKEVEISRQKHSRNFMSRDPSVSPARGESQLTVPITGKSTMHRVQEEEVEEEEEEGGGIDAGVKSFSATRRSEQRIEFNQNVTKDREDGDLFDANSKNAKEAEEVPRKDTGRNVGKNRSFVLGKAKGSVGPTTTSTNQVKDSSRGQRNIEDFLMVRDAVPASQVFADKEKTEKFKRELEKIKKQAMDDMKRSANSHKSKLPLQQKKPSNLVKTAKATQKQRPAKPIDKAFIVNGQVYKVPRLLRPKYWVTDRLYKYLRNQLEPKYTLQTRVVSEKFVQQLSNVTSFIAKQKSYTSYKAELHALMKEMARLDIIRTRFEFYIFCQEFLPYELRIKVVPMLLPGNKRNIPYDKNKLHEPLLPS